MDRTERKDCQAAQRYFLPAGKAASCRLLALSLGRRSGHRRRRSAGSLGLRASQPRGSWRRIFILRPRLVCLSERPLSSRSSVTLGEGPALMTLFQINCVDKGHILEYRGQDLNTSFWGDTIQPMVCSGVLLQGRNRRAACEGGQWEGELGTELSHPAPHPHPGLHGANSPWSTMAQQVRGSCPPWAGC